MIRSRVDAKPHSPLAPFTQALAVHGRGGARSVHLEEHGAVEVEGRRVQRAYVLSWACVRSDKGASFVSLGYACAIDAGEPGACRSGKEWFRLLDARGRAADAAAPREGSAQTRLMATLGLTDVLEAGVQMHDVLGSP